jgi:hypothetical protein
MKFDLLVLVTAVLATSQVAEACADFKGMYTFKLFDLRFQCSLNPIRLLQ